MRGTLGVRFVMAALWLLGSASLSAALLLPNPIERTLPQGMRVVIFPDSSLPVAHLLLRIGVGSREDPVGKSGLSQLLANSLARGTTSRSLDQFVADLEQIGATFAATANRDYTILQINVVSREFTSAVQLLAEAVSRPALDEAALGRSRSSQLDAIAAAGAEPGLAADRQLWALAQDPHPYAWPPLGTMESVSRIAPADLQAQHAAYYRPANAVLAIAGDVDAEAVFQAVAGAFAGWEGDPVSRIETRSPAPGNALRVRVLDYPGRARAILRVGSVGPPPGRADHIPLLVMNQLLTGAILQQVHAAGLDREGDAIDASSALLPLKDGTLLSVSMTSKPKAAGAALEAVRAGLKALRSRPPAPAEVARVKRYLEQTIPLQLDGPVRWLSEWMAADYYGLPADYLGSFRKRIESVSAGDVQRVAKGWLDADRLVVVAVGPGEELRVALGNVAPVQVAALDAPLPLSALADPAEKPSSESEAAARQLLARAVAAHGGETALKTVRSSQVDGRIRLAGSPTARPVTFRTLKKDPFRMSFRLVSPSGDSTMEILDGQKGWVMRGETIEPADSFAVRTMRVSFDTDPLHLLRLAMEPSSSVARVGESEFYGTPADAIAVRDGEGRRWKLYFSSANGTLAGVEQTERRGGREMTIARRFREYRPEGGIQWPHFEERRANQVLIVSFLTDQVRLNPTLADSVFAPLRHE